MTYRELKKQMENWTNEQLDSDLTIVIMEESESFHAYLSFVENDDTDDFGLENGHPFLYPLYQF